jgi:hypothetical protein
MALLVDTLDVMNRLGMDESLVDDATPAIETAIRSATIRLESEMDTKLDKASSNELFYTDSSSFSGIQPNGAFRLLLAQGFVRSSPAVVVQVTDKWNSVIETIDSTYFTLDYKKGLVLLDDKYADFYIRVTYDHGFISAKELNENEPWIKEALLCYAPLVLNAGRQENSGGGGDQGSINMWRLQGDMAKGLISRYTRKVGFSHRPLVVTPS